MFLEATHRHVGSLNGKGALMDDATKPPHRSLSERIETGPLVMVVESGVVVIRKGQSALTLERLWVDEQAPRPLTCSLAGRSACLALNGDASRVAVLSHSQGAVEGAVHAWNADGYRVLSRTVLAPANPKPATPARTFPTVPKGVRFDLDGRSAWALMSSCDATELGGDRTHRLPESMFGGSAVSDFQFDSGRSDVVWFEADFGRLGAAKIGSDEAVELAKVGHGTMGSQAGWVDMTGRWIAVTGNDSRDHFLMDRTSQQVVQSLGTDFAITARGQGSLLALSGQASLSAPYLEGPVLKRALRD